MWATSRCGPQADVGHKQIWATLRWGHGCTLGAFGSGRLAHVARCGCALPLEVAAQTSNEATTPGAQTGSAASAGSSAQKAPNAQAAGQTSGQTTGETTAKTTAKAASKSEAKRAERLGVNKAKGKREARLTKTKRMAKHSHKMRYAKGRHGKRFVTSHRGRHAFGYSARGASTGITGTTIASPMGAAVASPPLTSGV
jgi:hypothetical protein